jgi:NTP pyrophosphatase (non-canonical NTP hydrolase)
MAARRKTTEKGSGPEGRPPTTLEGFQAQIEALYGRRDRERGLATTFMWFAEEVGELSRALRQSDRANLEEEFADVLAWLATLASMAGVDLAQATNKYLRGCPRCRKTPCGCPHRRQAHSKKAP